MVRHRDQQQRQRQQLREQHDRTRSFALDPLRMPQHKDVEWPTGNHSPTSKARVTSGWVMVSGTGALLVAFTMIVFSSRMSFFTTVLVVNNSRSEQNHHFHLLQASIASNQQNVSSPIMPGRNNHPKADGNASPRRRNSNPLNLGYGEYTNDSIIISKPPLPRMAYVTFSHLKDHSRFIKYIFPALDTWLAPAFNVTGNTLVNSKISNEKDDLVYHVVLNKQWKKAYYQDLCAQNRYARYCKRIRPLWVDCPEGKFGESPCCKQQEGLLLLLKQQNERPYSYVTYHDDDVYLRSHKLQDFLARTFPNQEDNVFILTAGGAASRALGQSGYLKKPSYRCTHDNKNFTYPWGQPVVYSRGALETIQRGLEANGLVQQCQTFNVTHDAGNAIFHWMYSLPELRIRIFTFPNRDDPKSFGSHGVEHKIVTRANKGLSGKRQRRGHGQRQQEAVTTTTLTMHQVHAKFQSIASKDPTRPFRWHNVSGFQQTETYRQHGDPSSWKDGKWFTMPTSDCLEKASSAAATTV